MIFFPASPVEKTTTLKQLVAAMDGYFDKGWKNFEEEILRELALAANDYSFLNDFVHGEILAGKWPKLYGAQSFLCHEGKDYFIRLNLWFPEKESPVADQIKKYFSIDLLHNHNFPLFTVGLFGPGYTTQIFRWNEVSDDHKVGDQLNIEFTAQPTLSLGSVLYIERDADYHIQMWPKAFSISLNVIPTTKEDYSKCQFILNDDRTVYEILYTGLTPGSRQKS